MRESTLELRRLEMIAIGYVVSPLCGLTALWLIYMIRWSSDGAPADWSKAFDIWALMVIIGGFVCLIVEVVVVTPTLLAFHRYGAPWQNSWTAVASGFALGAGLWLSLALLAGVDNSLDLQRALHEAVDMGVVGAVAAIAFRLLAVRRRQAD